MQAQVNQTEHFTRLWTKAQPTLFRTIYALLPSSRDAEDVLQEVAVAALRKFGQYDPDKSFMAWVRGIARNEVLRSRRDSARSLLSANSEIVEAIGEACERMKYQLDERENALQRCLNNVGGTNRRMLELRYSEGLSPSQIASHLGRPASWVRTVLTRVRYELEQCIRRCLAVDGGVA